jgi:hypothetical protein
MGGDQHQKMQQMKHATPMPNYMQIVKKHGDFLDLNEAQAKRLGDWRQKAHAPMQKMVHELLTLEKEMMNASFQGENSAKLASMLEESLNIRRNIALQKNHCRDNMRGILTDEQWKRVVELYTDKMAAMK